jgi:hypothetical protein
MNNLSFGPQELDITLYAGDNYKISLEVLSVNNAVYTTTGSWKINFFNKGTGATIDTSPSGVTFSPDINSSQGVTELSISKTLSQLFNSTASVIYEFYLQHDGRGDKYTFLTGDVHTLTKEETA